MKKVVPSTACGFTVVLKRELGTKLESHSHAKFYQVREAINRLLAEFDTPSNRVVSIKVSINIEAQQ